MASPVPGLRAATFLVVVASAQLALSAAPAAEEGVEAERRRPRVGLVLSGGGARGAAHIGVIQVLEELRIPVDYVVGTSMGSIVGGLYAAGYSPEQMAKVIADADWSTLLSDAPPRDELWFRRRQDNRRFQVDLEFGLADGALTLPPGLILGRNVEAFLERLFLPVEVAAGDTTTFDEMQLPFRCVATDVADGSEVVLDRGSVARAIRASMSLPGVFAPVEWNGRLLVDGGIVDNVPVAVARGLGAEVIIAVDISTPLADTAALGSVLAISDQVVGILMQENRRRSLDSLTERDVSIVPDLGTISVLQFQRCTEAIELGRQTTSAMSADLARFSVDDEAWAKWLEGHRAPVFDPPRVRNVTVSGNLSLSDEVVREYSAIRSGAPLDRETLARTRERIAGLGIVDRIEIAIRPVEGSDSDEVDIDLRPTEKAWGPHYFRFGLGVSSDLQGDGEFDLGIQHTWTPANSWGGEWRNEVQIGTRTRLFTQFYQPLDPGLRWFVSPEVEYNHDNVPLIVNRQKVAQFDIEAIELGLRVGRNLGSWGELSVRYGWLSGTAEPDIAFPGTVPARAEVDAGRLTTRLLVDTLDRIAFPRDGLLASVEWEFSDDSFGADSRQSRLEALAGVPLTFGALTVFPLVEGGSTLEGESAVGSEFFLGGFRRLSGLAPRELSGNHYALGVVQTYLQLSERTTQFDLETYLGASLEVGGIWQERSDALDDDDLLVGGSLFLGADSLIGPAYLGVGFTEGGETAVYVFVGPTF